MQLWSSARSGARVRKHRRAGKREQHGEVPAAGHPGRSARRTHGTRARAGRVRDRQQQRRRRWRRCHHLDLGRLDRGRGQDVRAPGGRVPEPAPGPEGQQPVRQQRQHAAEGADRGPRRQPAGHRLPLRVVGAERGADPAGGEPDQRGPAPRGELERLLGRRAGRGHGQGQGDRRPRPGQQPGRGLQQDAVRQGPSHAAGPGLDLVAVPGRREEADRPGHQAVRHRVRDPGFRGHGVALGGAALGGRRPDPDRR